MKAWQRQQRQDKRRNHASLRPQNKMWLLKTPHACEYEGGKVGLIIDVRYACGHAVELIVETGTDVERVLLESETCHRIWEIEEEDQRLIGE